MNSLCIAALWSRGSNINLYTWFRTVLLDDMIHKKINIFALKHIR